VIAAMTLFAGVAAMSGAQSQEPKPPLPATPVEQSELPPEELPTTGVTDSSWQGPNMGVRVAWDPAVWSVQAEQIVPGYDGLQLGTPLSTVYIEAYEGFAGDAQACLDDAEREIDQREGVNEVTALEGRPLPVAADARGPARLYGITATLPDGAPLRATEYVECRTIVPGQSVLEITWQTLVASFNEDFPRVEALFATLEVPAAQALAATPAALATPLATAGTPVATPAAPLATPVG
jgi:hypothetical protein